MYFLCDTDYISLQSIQSQKCQPHGGAVGINKVIRMCHLAEQEIGDVHLLDMATFHWTCGNFYLLHEANGHVQILNDECERLRERKRQ